MPQRRIIPVNRPKRPSSPTMHIVTYWAYDATGAYYSGMVVLKGPDDLLRIITDLQRRIPGARYVTHNRWFGTIPPDLQPPKTPRRKKS